MLAKIAVGFVVCDRHSFFLQALVLVNEVVTRALLDKVWDGKVPIVQVELYILDG